MQTQNPMFLVINQGIPLSCTNKSSDWLCLYMPEQDLPKQFQPKNVEMIAVKHDVESIARNFKAKKMCAYGFNMRDCVATLKSSADKEEIALRRLVDATCHLSLENDIDTAITKHAFSQEVDDEIDSLQSIYGPQCAIEWTDEACVIALSLEDVSMLVTGPLVVEFHIPFGLGYPSKIPTILFPASTLPASIRFAALITGNRSHTYRIAILKKIAISAQEMTGDAMIFGLATWLGTEVDAILRSPPSLVSLKPTLSIPAVVSDDSASNVSASTKSVQSGQSSKSKRGARQSEFACHAVHAFNHHRLGVGGSNVRETQSRVGKPTKSAEIHRGIPN